MPISAAQVQLVAGANPAGVSIDLNLGRVLTGVGFCVAYAATQNNHGPHGLAASMIHANGANGSGIIGAWTHGGLVYYDSVKKYNDRASAVRAAQSERQIAIYNLGTQTVEDILDPASGSFNASLATAGRKRAHSF